MANLNNLVSINGYDAGKNKNLLVSLDTDLCIKLNSNVDKSAVKLYIAGARITSEEAVDKFEELVDEDTPANLVIIVSEKFMKLGNKKQLALLEYENIKLQELQEDYTLAEYAEVAAETLVRKNHGWWACRALDKSKDYTSAQTKKAAKVLAKQDKKDEKAAKKLAKANAKAAKKAGKGQVVPQPASESTPEPVPAQ